MNDIENGISSSLKLVVSDEYKKAIEHDLQYLCNLAANPRASVENQIKLQTDAIVRSMNEAYDMALKDFHLARKKIGKL